jgi:hypothetical protein
VSNQLPEQSGVFEISAEPFPFTREEYKPIRIGNVLNLSELVKTHTLFTHAALFVFGNWLQDPLFAYMGEEPNINPFIIEFSKPIFSGFNCKYKTDYKPRYNNDWNYLLFGCENKYWPGLLKFFQELQGFEPGGGRYHCTIVQKLPLVDQLQLSSGKPLPIPLPMVDVYMVAYDGNDRLVHFKPAKNPPLDQIKAVFDEPDPGTVDFAKLVLEGKLHELATKSPTVEV